MHIRDEKIRTKSQHCFIFTESQGIKITKNNKDIFVQGNKKKIKSNINVHGDYQLTTIEYHKCVYDFSRLIDCTN